MTPEDRQKIRFSLTALGQHFPRRTRTDAETALWLSDWYADLEGFTPDDVAGACAQWRTSGKTRFPSSVELVGLIRTLRRRASDGGGKPEPWRPLTDAEYAPLPLRDKAHYHEIAANHVMDGWRSSLTPRQVDDEWRRRDRRRQNHFGEAARLRRVLASVEAA